MSASLQRLGGGCLGPSPTSRLSPLSFLFVIEHMMPLCMVISWVYSVAMTIQHIVAEKEHRLKEVGLGGCRRPLGEGRPAWEGRSGSAVLSSRLYPPYLPHR